MPYINTKYSASITPEQETVIKSALGEAISLIGKSEDWLMLGFEQNCSMYFKGEKIEKLAYVEVNLYGSASSASYSKLTGEICRIYGEVLGIPADKVYVKYSATNDWGWNGRNL